MESNINAGKTTTEIIQLYNSQPSFQQRTTNGLMTKISKMKRQMNQKYGKDDTHDSSNHNSEQTSSNNDNYSEYSYHSQPSSQYSYDFKPLRKKRRKMPDLVP